MKQNPAIHELFRNEAMLWNIFLQNKTIPSGYHIEYRSRFIIQSGTNVHPNRVPTPPSFSKPIPQGDFVVQAGATVHIVSGTQNILGPGTHFEAGSNTRVLIEENPRRCDRSAPTSVTHTAAPRVGNFNSEDKPDKFSSLGKPADFTIYPNPAQNRFTVETYGETTGKFIVMTIQGKTVGTYRVEKNTKLDIDATDFSAGVYVCTFVGESGKSSSQKLIVTK